VIAEQGRALSDFPRLCFSAAVDQNPEIAQKTGGSHRCKLLEILRARIRALQCPPEFGQDVCPEYQDIVSAEITLILCARRLVRFVQARPG
jgi:hypothetical protein